MQLKTSYRQILAISAPIMLGSAAQNVIQLTDSLFLLRYEKVFGYGDGGEFGTIGFVGVFYLVIAAIGYGFSKGGQIMIARRCGQDRPKEVGRTFYAMLYFELGLAILMFLFLYYGSYYFFSLFTDNDRVFYLSLDYLSTRSWGVFFSYIGVAIIALYTGIARTKFIIIDTIILGIVNIVLNYCLIFGEFGFPQMGIAGAGLASTIAEVVAFVVFLIYMIFDKKIRDFQLWKFPKIDWELIKVQLRLSIPIVAQAVVGLGSWFVFFGIVENLGQRQLDITNLVRNVYLILAIPCWGFASGVNTLVSNFIGAGARRAVYPIIKKTAWLCLIVTVIITLPVLLFPEYILYPVFAGSGKGVDISLIVDARPILYVLGLILALFAIGGVFFNGLAGTGATWFGLKLQTLCAFLYLGFIYIAVEFTNTGLVGAWCAEVFYWILIIIAVYWYLKSKKWYKLKV